MIVILQNERDQTPPVELSRSWAMEEMKGLIAGKVLDTRRGPSVIVYVAALFVYAEETQTFEFGRPRGVLRSGLQPASHH